MTGNGARMTSFPPSTPRGGSRFFVSDRVHTRDVLGGLWLPSLSNVCREIGQGGPRAGCRWFCTELQVIQNTNVYQCSVWYAQFDSTAPRSIDGAWRAEPCLVFVGIARRLQVKLRNNAFVLRTKVPSLLLLPSGKTGIALVP